MRGKGDAMGGKGDSSGREKRHNRAKVTLSVSHVSTPLAALLMVLLAAPANAQMDFPDHPPEPGQSLLDWADPPMLKYEIPPEKRGDLSTCSEGIIPADVETVAQTCWPILKAYKLQIRMEFAEADRVKSATSKTGSGGSGADEALAYADQLIAEIPDPQWYLQSTMLIKAHGLRASILARKGDWDAALAANAAEMDQFAALSPYDRDWYLAFALNERVDYLLGAGRREEARAILAEVLPLIDKPDGERLTWPISDMNETLVKDAIRMGDWNYANAVNSRYLDILNTVSDRMQMGLTDALDLGIYLAAQRRDHDAVISLMDRRIADMGDRPRCYRHDRMFPYVAASLRDDPQIAARLAQIGCSPEVMDKMGEVAETGIVDSDGTIILPALPIE